jgi:hypothetical protein
VGERALHVLDIETLSGGTAPAAADARASFERCRVAGAWHVGDHTVAAASTWFFTRVRFALPAQLRVLPAGGGPDAADRRLLAELDPAWVAAHYRRVVFGSGDGAFAGIAAELGDLGVRTWAVAWRSGLSRHLARAVHEVHLLDGTTRLAA